MNMKVADRIFGLLLVAGTVWFLIQANGFNVTARRMPLMVGTFTLICLIAYFASEFWPGKKAKPAKDRADEDEYLEVKDDLNWYDVRVWGWLIILFACIMVAGLAVGLGILTVLFYVYAAKGSWKAGLLFGVLQTAFLYAVFEMAFQTVLYRGIIFEMLFQ